jgi:hypothetical protein
LVPIKENILLNTKKSKKNRNKKRMKVQQLSLKKLKMKKKLLKKYIHLSAVRLDLPIPHFHSIIKMILLFNQIQKKQVQGHQM